jgi:hypothetical protein
MEGRVEARGWRGGGGGVDNIEDGVGGIHVLCMWVSVVLGCEFLRVV